MNLPLTFYFAMFMLFESLSVLGDLTYTFLTFELFEENCRPILGAILFIWIYFFIADLTLLFFYWIAVGSLIKRMRQISKLLNFSRCRNVMFYDHVPNFQARKFKMSEAKLFQFELDYTKCLNAIKDLMEILSIPIMLTLLFDTASTTIALYFLLTTPFAFDGNLFNNVSILIWRAISMLTWTTAADEFNKVVSIECFSGRAFSISLVCVRTLLKNRNSEGTVRAWEERWNRL